MTRRWMFAVLAAYALLLGYGMLFGFGRSAGGAFSYNLEPFHTIRLYQIGRASCRERV